MLPGAVSAPGGQLVQATDQYVGTLGARLVLVDPLEVRALMTASWLKQMGWEDVFVLRRGGTRDRAARARRARPRRRAGAGDRRRVRSPTCWRGGEATVLDLAIEPRLPRGPYRGRLVRDPRAARRALPRVPAARDPGADVGGRHAGAARGARGRRRWRAAPVLHLEGGNARLGGVGRRARCGRGHDGGRAARSVAQGL